jgi:hypothetical protein
MKDSVIVLDPCSENWDRMTPNEQGRHCTKCVKTVHEVHHISNEEVMQKVAETGGNFCIRIAKDRVIPLPKPWYTRMKYAISAAILSLLLSAKSTLLKAQTVNSDNQELDKHKIIEQCTLTGTVIDSIENNTPLPFTFVTVTLPDSSMHRTYADALGKFSLQIDKKLSTGDSLTITCTMIGYKETQIVSAIKDTIDMEVFLAQQHICLKTAVIHVEKQIIQGTTMGGAPIDRSSNPRLYRKILDDYDTKTYHHDEIERYNLGR